MIRTRADADVQVLALGIELEPVRPMTLVVALQRNNLFASAGCHRLRIILIALDRCRLGDVQILFPPSQPVRPVEPFQQFLMRLAAIGQHHHRALSRTFSHQHFTSRTLQHEARLLQSRSIFFSRESGGQRQLRRFRPSDQLARISGVRRRVRSGQIGDLLLGRQCACRKRQETSKSEHRNVP